MKKILTNHHTHTHFSDGSGAPEDYVNEAVKKGFTALGFTEHSPLPFDTPFSFQIHKLERYQSEVKKLIETYNGRMDIFLGMEMDFIPGISEDFPAVREQFACEYLIGSVHLVKPGDNDSLWFIDGPLSEIYDAGIRELFHGDIKKAVGAYFKQLNQMIITQEFEILGHFDKIKMHNRGRFFSEEEKWYTGLVDESIELISQRGLVVEINTRGIYKKRSDTTYPGPAILKKLKEKNIPVMLNSDAHQPHELDGAFEKALEIIAEAGITELVVPAPGGRGFENRSLC